MKRTTNRIAEWFIAPSPCCRTNCGRDCTNECIITGARRIAAVSTITGLALLYLVFML
jgi:hypothetical protein